MVLVTPALADANNGNWQTARRWSQMLAGHYEPRLCAHWEGPAAETADDAPVAMIALHARRSAASIAGWKHSHPEQPLIVVLTGTDLYRDIDGDADARKALLERTPAGSAGPRKRRRRRPSRGADTPAPDDGG